MFLRALIVVIALLFAGSVRAEDAAYAEPTWANLLHTMVRFNVLDLSDPDLIDEYGSIEECDLYNAFYTNDFKWNQVRAALRQSAKLNEAKFPTTYYYTAKMQLDRYDFTSKIFRFAPKSVINNVNTFALLTVTGSECGRAEIKYIPRIFRAVIPTAIYMEGLPLSDKEAETVLQEMAKAGDTDRSVYVRFGLRITYIAPFHRLPPDPKAMNKPVEYGQGTGHSYHTLRLDAQLDDVEFYYDQEMTKLIYKYQM